MAYVAPKLRELLALLKKMAAAQDEAQAIVVAADLQDRAYVIELEVLLGKEEVR